MAGDINLDKRLWFRDHEDSECEDCGARTATRRFYLHFHDEAEGDYTSLCWHCAGDRAEEWHTTISD